MPGEPIDPRELYSQITCLPGAEMEALDMGDGSQLRLWRPDSEPIEPLTVPDVFDRYLQFRAKYRPLAQRTVNEYRTTQRDWRRWEAAVLGSESGATGMPLGSESQATGGGRGAGIHAAKKHRSGRPMLLGEITPRTIEDFLDWKVGGSDCTNPGRLWNKARANLHAVFAWAAGGAGNTDPLIDACPAFPPKRQQRDRAGFCYLELSEIDRLYWATWGMQPARNWRSRLEPGVYWRAALVLLFNFGLDSSTLFPHDAESRRHALRRRHIFPGEQPPSRQKPGMTSPYGWICWRRAKTCRRTGAMFEWPLTEVIWRHLEPILADGDPDELLMTSRGVCVAGGNHPNVKYRRLCLLAGLAPKLDPITGEARQWDLKDWRKIAAAWADAADYGQAAQLLGHTSDGTTYRHYVDRQIRACRAILNRPQPPSFRSIVDPSIERPDRPRQLGLFD